MFSDMNSRTNATQKKRSQLKTARPISFYDNLETTSVTCENVSTSLTINSPDNKTIKDDANIQMNVTVVNGSKQLKKSSKLTSLSQKQCSNMKQLNTNENNDSLRFEVRNNSMTSLRSQVTPTLTIMTTASVVELPDANSTNSKNIVDLEHSENKPVISDAKSKFFGFNNNYNSLKRSIENNGSNEVGITTITIITTSVESENTNNKSLVTTHCKPVTLISNNNNNNNNNKNNIQQTLFESRASTNNQKDYVINEKYSKITESIEIPQQQQQNFSGSINVNNKTDIFRSSSNDMDSNHPSQLVYMSTTVPQNIKGNDIAGRHTPTRNSLRHSRMLVINKNFQGPKIKNPLGLRYPNLTRILLIHQVIFGMLLTSIGFWILLWAPNTRLQDNPYWSGITLTLAGILGLILIKFKRMKRHKIREHCFIFLKYDSYLLTIIASALCLIALICASIHLYSLSLTTTKCTSTDMLIANAACTCVFGSNTTNNIIQNAINDENEEFYYRDLSCSEVFGAWKFILTVSILLNALGFCTTLFYIVSVFWKNKKYIYSSVRTNSF